VKESLYEIGFFSKTEAARTEAIKTEPAKTETPKTDKVDDLIPAVPKRPE